MPDTPKKPKASMKYIDEPYPTKIDSPQDSPSASTEGVEPVSEVGQILDELATSVHNLHPGDIGSKDRVLIPIWKAEAAIERLIAEARIEELEHVTCHKHGFGKDSCRQIKERISELNQMKGKTV